MQIPAPLPWVVSVEGATASGKTAVALAIATGFGVPVISADARQCYRELRIGVARPTPEELALAPHYFIADRSVQEPLSAGAFEREALSLLKQLHSAHNVVVVAGGSGLYVKALLEGFDHFPPVPEKIRSELRATLELQGISALQELLLSEDPDYYREVDRHNPHRLLRALEVCRSAGLPYSSFRKKRLEARPFRTLRLMLKRERADLYARIDARVDGMLEAGLEAEARELLPYRNLTPLDTVGYQELFACFDGMLTMAQAVEAIKRNTRRYAKRQLTWLRSQPGLQPVNPDDTAALIAYLRGQLLL